MSEQHNSMPLQQKTVSIGVLFGVMLTLANILATKIIAFRFYGATITVTAGVFPIAIAFLCTDVLSETIGKDNTRKWVNAAVGSLAIAWIMIVLSVQATPAPSWSGQSQYAAVLSASMPIIAASILTFAVSQHLDITVFHWILDYTGQPNKWARNLGSTWVSQFVDTALFTVLAFRILPLVLGGVQLPVIVMVQIIVAEYAIKAGIAIIDTPVFYTLTHDST